MYRSDLDPSREILEQVAFGNGVSQRSLARSTGIALGLANLLIRRMVGKGWVRMVPVRPNRVSYVITPAGRAEKARRSRAYLAGSVQHYVRVRDQISQRFASLSAEWSVRENRNAEKRIVFCGAGDVAEIGYFCLQGTDLQLAGVVDHCAGKPFFGMSVSPYEALAPGTLGDVPFQTLVVMSFSDVARIRRQLARVGYPASRVFWI
jgi:DNA-binding MarR family transcriptional regulator